MRQFLAVFLLALAAACAGGDSKIAPEPDEEFGADGVVRFGFTETHERPYGLTFDGSGRIVAVGRIAEAEHVVRLLPDGTIDVSFGDAGFSEVAQDSSGTGATSVYVLADGTILGALTTGLYDFSLFKLTEDGAPENGFGVGGLQAFDLATQLGGSADELLGSTMDAQGRVVAFGRIELSGVLARFTVSGSLDSNFAGGAGAIRDDETTQLEAAATDGSEIIAVGSSGGSMVITRYQEDGARVLTFGTAGRLILSGGLGRKSVAVDASGRILVAGVRGYEVDAPRSYLLALNADGTTDESFGSLGSVEFDLDPKVPDSYAFDVHPLADGSMLVGVNTIESGSFSGGRALLVRVLPDGSVDPTFGGSGFVSTPNLTRGFGIAVDGDEHAVLYGEEGGHFDSAWVLFRVSL